MVRKSGNPSYYNFSGIITSKSLFVLLHVIDVLFLLFKQVKFVDAILSNNSTDDHCREFVRHKGLVPLIGILGLPNLPLDFPSSPSCQAVCSVSKSLLVRTNRSIRIIISYFIT